jgi:hypothetical protein
MKRQSIGLVSLVVRDYDEALNFSVGALGFAPVEDTYVPEQSKRWVVVSPPGSTESGVLLARASTPEEESRTGSQTGGRVFLFLYTDDFWRDYESLKAKGVALFATQKNIRMELSPYSRICTVITGTCFSRNANLPVSSRFIRKGETNDDHDDSMFLRFCGDTTYRQASTTVLLPLRRLSGRARQSLCREPIPGAGGFSNAWRYRRLYSKNSSPY